MSQIYRIVKYVADGPEVYCLLTSKACSANEGCVCHKMGPHIALSGLGSVYKNTETIEILTRVQKLNKTKHISRWNH